MGLLDLLTMPEAKQAAAFDDRELTLLHRRMLERKPFLGKVYIRWYNELMSHVAEAQTGAIIELGSGAGFIQQLYPRVQTSDVLDLPGLDKVIDAADMPFDNESVDAILMINVLHHMKNVERFFVEASRVLKARGRIVMIEPANTPWARFIYSRFHHEGFDPEAGWQVEGQRPLLDGNDALAWIIFTRDREVFESKFPGLRIAAMRRHTPIAYLLSGGFTLRQLLPGWAFTVVRVLEAILQFANAATAMFQTIVLEKRGHED